MKLTSIIILLTHIVMVKGTWLAATVSPVILSIGSLFTAVNQDVLDIHPMSWKDWLPEMPWKGEKEEYENGNPPTNEAYDEV